MTWMSVEDMVRARWGTGQRVGETDTKGRWAKIRIEVDQRGDRVYQNFAHVVRWGGNLDLSHRTLGFGAGTGAVCRPMQTDTKGQWELLLENTPTKVSPVAYLITR